VADDDGYVVNVWGLATDCWTEMPSRRGYAEPCPRRTCSYSSSGTPTRSHSRVTHETTASSRFSGGSSAPGSCDGGAVSTG
jgi:hypothetical protein